MHARHHSTSSALSARPRTDGGSGLLPQAHCNQQRCQLAGRDRGYLHGRPGPRGDPSGRALLAEARGVVVGRGAQPSRVAANRVFGFHAVRIPKSPRPGALGCRDSARSTETMKTVVKHFILTLILVASPSAAMAQRLPATVAGASGGDGGLFMGRLSARPTLEGFYEYYISPRNSLRIGVG